MDKLIARELRQSKPNTKDLSKIKKNPIYFVLDEIIDTYNIGSLFRLADACGIKKVYLCGNMEYPPSSRIHKSAVGTENWVPWEKSKKTEDVIKKLKEKGCQIVIVEQNPNSIPIKNLKVNFPCAIVVGNETFGIKKEVLNKGDIVVELPMFGINKSFNVWGSAAVVTYKILEQL